MEATPIFLRHGKHGGAPRGAEIGQRAVSVGLRAALAPSAELARELAGTIELHFYDGGYAGLLLQEDGAANLCLTAARGRLADGPEALVAALAREAPLLAERLGGARPEWEAIAGVPLAARTGYRSRLYLVGDAAVTPALRRRIAGAASGLGAAQACRTATDGRPRLSTLLRQAAKRPPRHRRGARHMAERR